MRGNPRDSANVVSYFTFGYTLPLFKKGFQRELLDDDLFDTTERCRSHICGKRTEKHLNKNKSLFNLMLRRFGMQYLIMFAAIIIWTQAYSVFQPYAMSRLISYFEANQTKISKTEAIYSGAIVVSFKILHAFFWKNMHVWEVYLTIECCTLMRTLLYQKIIKLSKGASSTAGIGNIITLITKDLYCIEINLWVILDVSALVLQTITGSYLLWAKIGNCAFVGLGILFTTIPLQFYLSYIQTKLRLTLGKNSDNRLQLMQESLSSLKIIKMYSWENVFINKILEARKKEIKALIRLMYIRSIVIAIGNITSKVTSLMLIIYYLWMGYNPSVETIFYIYAIVGNVAGGLNIAIPLNLSSGAQMKASFMRVRDALEAEEIGRKEEGNSEEDPSIVIENVHVVFGGNETLSGVSLRAKSGLTVITGTVGSGKSSLLKVILQELPVSKGYLKLNGSLSYASQEAWLFPATIKQNILLGEKFEHSRYQKVIEVCDLKYDLSHMDKGDETVVLDRGQNLSKGQQARINLARAVYRKSDIYLLDDPLAALDGRVKECIFNDCIKGFLKESICVFVTQNKNHVLLADYVLILDKGKVISSGTPKEFEKHFYEESHENFLESKEIDRPQVNDKIEEVDKLLEKPNAVYHEVKNTGRVKWKIYKKYFEFGGALWIHFLIFFLYVISEFFSSYSQKLMTNWVDKHQETIAAGNSSDFIKSDKENAENLVLTKYMVFTVLDSTMGVVKYYVFLTFCKNISVNIHKVMSKKIIGAMMSFFDDHLIGNIINRFSLDMNNVDEYLPFIFPSIIEVILSCFGSVILISTVNWYLALPLGIVLVLLLLVRWFCISANRNLKRLEAGARSPMIGHMNSTVEGLLTIRASRAERHSKQEFYHHQDNYNSAVFTQQISDTAFNFFVEALSAALSAVVVIRFLFFDHDTSVGDVGLAISQVFSLATVVQSGITICVNLETNMTSVERIIEYTEAPQENMRGLRMENWPRNGSIIFDRVSMMYNSSREPVLKNICFSIRPREKIGIVGRTGSGKSSIISTLFRLYDFEGNVYVDGVDIRMLSLSFLRKNIAIIPQDPTLFTGTLRENIDPYLEYSDQKIWDAMRRVNITGSLDDEVRHSSFSSGQKQLICLIRAVLRGVKIVVLDEATANMDSETDRILQDVIEEAFSRCTVLTVAHRLHTIYNCDKVIIMNDGKLVEFGNPKLLRNEEGSHFSKMVSRDVKL